MVLHDDVLVQAETLHAGVEPIGQRSDAGRRAAGRASRPTPTRRPRAGRALRGAAFALAVASLVAARPDTPERPAAGGEGEGGPGRVLYLTHCHGCHGLEGRGDGPAAASLRTRPADLTQLWRRYGTPLDRARVAAYIDGRGLLEVHGAREMPVWGDEFFEDAPPLTPNLVEGAKQHLISVLVDYLETLQSQRRS